MVLLRKTFIGIILLTQLIFTNTATAIPLNILPPTPEQAQEVNRVYSALWGKHGELFDAKGRLPHVALAGYKYGLEPIPYAVIKYNVKDFGAKGDGTTDDSTAFQKALAQTPAGVIFVPEGQYLLKEPLKITQSGTVLRGAGPEKTQFIFPMYGEKVKWDLLARANQWDWRISAEGGNKKATKSKRPFTYSAKYGGKNLAKMSKPSSRGDYSFTVDSAKKFKPGMEIVISQHTKHKAETKITKQAQLLFEIGGGQMGGPEAEIGLQIDHIALVEKVEGKRIYINKPFRFTMQTTVRTFAPKLHNIGIEDLSLQFPSAPFPYHFGGNSHNGINFNHIAHSWIRNVKMNNVDNGIYITGIHNTVSDITYNADRMNDRDYLKARADFDHEEIEQTEVDKYSEIYFSNPLANGKKYYRVRGSTGHHSTTLSLFDNLATRITLNTPFIHEITYNRSIGNVVSEVTSKDMSLDHHRRLPADNVWTNIDAGEGTRLWLGTGRSKEGLRMGKNITLWNVNSERPQGLFKIWHDDDDAKTKSWKNYSTGFINIIGVNMKADAKHKNSWIEHAQSPESNTRLHPANIHLAQKNWFRQQHDIKTVSFTGQIKAKTEGVTASFNVFSNKTIPPHYFLWKFGDGSTSRAIQPSHTFKKKGNYHVTLIMTDALNNESILNYSLDI